MKKEEGKCRIRSQDAIRQKKKKKKRSMSQRPWVKNPKRYAIFFKGKKRL